MGYSKGYHTTFRHRYHIVWAPKYQFKVLPGEVRLRVRRIIKQVCDELGVTSVRACCRATTPICSSKSPRTSRSATSFAGQRAGRRARSRRSEERGVGKACVSPCESRRTPYHKQ